tara:strand:- start:219 stop:1673 length:1455 start_codon:yes stop_codon:yes gene_type:complete
MLNNQNIGFDKLSEELGIEQLWDIQKLNLIKNKLSYFHWYNISTSNKVIWTENLLQEFKDELVWEKLVENKNIPWSLEFCKKTRNIIPWKKFSEHFIFYSVFEKEMITFLGEFKNEIDWNLLSANNSIKWNLIFQNDFDTQKNAFELFLSYWNPIRLSRNKEIWGFRDKIIKHLNSKLDWKLLSENPSFIWSVELLEEHKTEINWSHISRKSKYNIPWSIKLLRRFQNELEWSSISQNSSIDFSLDLVSEFESFWENKKMINYPSNGYYWACLSENIGKKFDLELIEKYKHKWYWDKLLLNKNINWTSELIEQFTTEIYKIDSRDYYGKSHMMEVLYKNKEIPFSLPILDKLADKWSICNFRGSTKKDGFYTTGEWFEYSNNNHITVEIISKFGTFLNVGAIIKNPNLNWNIDLIKSIINIDTPKNSDAYNLGFDGDLILMQDWIDKEVGFKRNKKNIIKELKKKEYVKEILYEEFLKTYIEKN